jgi:CPA1 family monovalent cation:H+ antiporter
VVVFELVIALLFVGAVLAALARRMNAPYPALLALAGTALALLPDVPSVTLDPALALFVAPVLLDAAFDSSPRDLKANWQSVMRGIVTLAAALALPAGFPHRDLILFGAFAVVLGSKRRGAGAISETGVTRHR